MLSVHVSAALGGSVYIWLRSKAAARMSLLRCGVSADVETNKQTKKKHSCMVATVDFSPGEHPPFFALE